MPPFTLAAAAPVLAAAPAELPLAAETPPAIPVALPVAEPLPVDDALAVELDAALVVPPPAVAVSVEVAPLLADPVPFTLAPPLVLAPADALFASALAFAKPNDRGWMWTATGTDATASASELMVARSVMRDRLVVMG